MIESFRRSLDMAGHVSWVPGGTPIGSGRLGITVPVATGLALGLKARKGSEGLVLCHCGDAGWISGQALNGFTAASLHGAPIAFVMHRNGIQLSGTTKKIMDKDPRPVISALGIEILEIASLHDRRELFNAYKTAFQLAASATSLPDLSDGLAVQRNHVRHSPDTWREVRNRGRNDRICGANTRCP